MRGGYHHHVGVALCELLDTQALTVDRDRHDLHARLLDDQLVRVPARVLQRDRAHAVAAQCPAGERKALREAGADQHVLGVGGRAANAPQVLRRALRAAPARRAGRRIPAPRAARRAARCAASAASGRGESRRGRAGRGGSGRRSSPAATAREHAGSRHAPRWRPAPARPGACSGSPRPRAGRMPR